MNQFQNLPLTTLVASATNPRKTFDPVKLKELATTSAETTSTPLPAGAAIYTGEAGAKKPELTSASPAPPLAQRMAQGGKACAAKISL